MLRKVGIPDPFKRLSSYPFELSGGMCQRVVIAMALCCHSKLIIADEPTTALDVTTQAQILQLLRTLQKENNTAILLITHNLGVIWEMCEEVMVMYAGKAVEHASSERLYLNALHPYTWGLMDSMPSISGTVRQTLYTIPGIPPDLRLEKPGCVFCSRCRYVRDICHAEKPQLTEVEGDHYVACHLQRAGNPLTREEAGHV
jgi:oligopeptide/dipeptide ABC transporter ATP-binding protein